METREQRYAQCKATAPEALVAAIRTAIEGGICVSRSLAENLEPDRAEVRR